MSTKKEGWKRRIQGAQTPDEVRGALLEAEAPLDAVLEYLARHAPVWDEELLLLVLCSAAPPEGLVENRQLPEWARDRLVEWSLSRLKSEEDPVRLRLTSEALVSGLRRKRLRLLPEQLDALASMLAPERVNFQAPARERLYAVARALVECPESQAETLESVQETVERLFPGLLSLLLAHPRCPARLVSRALQAGGDRERASRLAFEMLSLRRLRLHPELRPLFLYWTRQWGEVGALECLAGDARPDARALLLDLLLLAPERLASLLVRQGKRLTSHLEPEDWTLLLSHPNPELRLATLRLSPVLAAAASGRAPQA